MSKRQTIVLFLSAAVCKIVLANGFVNIAIGKPVTFQREPTYFLARDPDDAKQLTDGKFADPANFWCDRLHCVGWQSLSVVVACATIDLGEEMPICGFSWQFAFGRAGVEIPESINVYVSSDGVSWYFAGALLDRALTLQGVPPPTQYRVFRAHAEDMPCHGRYVRFVATQKGFVFCDELEVYRGDDSLLKEPHKGASTSDPISFERSVQLQSRLLKEAEVAGASKDVVARISQEVDVGVLAKNPTVLPVCDVQRDIWAANVTRLRNRGYEEPVLWENCRWDNLSPIEVPAASSVDAKPVTLDMMRNEVRSASVNVLNPTSQELACEFSVEGFGDDVSILPHEVLYTDSRLFRVTASALRAGQEGRVSFTVPAGVSRQVWIMVRRPRGKPGVRKGTIVVRLSNGQILRRPFHLRVRNLDFPTKQSLRVGGWDFLDAAFVQKITNLEKVLELQRDIGMDTPWANRSTAPQNANFDESGNLVSELDFSRWDYWTQRIRPDAGAYALFWDVKDSFCGEKSGTSRFDRMVISYLKAWIAHARSKGLNGRRILLLLVDEPSTAEKQELICRWMRPIRRAGIPEFASFEDPQFEEPWTVSKEFWDLCDVICPITSMARKNDRVFAFWKDLASQGKEIWLYSAHGPSRTFDPVSYYRMQAWVAFAIGSKETSSHFWHFTYSGDSWHAYRQKGTEYSPYFLSEDGVMPSKQSEAIREGVEDYEYLVMLAAKIGRKKMDKLCSRVLERLPYGDPDWDVSGCDHDYLDKVRTAVLDRLEQEVDRD